MISLNLKFVLIDVNKSVNLNQISTLTYVKNSVSASFRRTRRVHKRISSSRSSSDDQSLLLSLEIRRPSNHRPLRTGFYRNSGNLTSTSSSSSSSNVVAELEILLDVLPLSMRKEISKHGEIGDLIEVVLNLGRKPLARFPTGDWEISKEMVKHEDIKHAISKVI